MIVKLFDGTEIKASDNLRQRVDTALSQSKSIIINGITISPKAIAYVKSGGHTEADSIKSTNLVSAGDARGQYSPAKEKLREMIKSGKLGELKNA